MKKQLTLLVGLIASGWAIQTNATETQVHQLKPVNTTVTQFEIMLEQPVIDVATSIREQVNNNLKPQDDAAAILLVRESRLRANQDRTARAD
ncbi:MAG: hypothetical protein HWE26_12815 [Alteromonadaceae bacterium]|nr:hypothetical protein [Alteromonadaceae bacterium]